MLQEIIIFAVVMSFVATRSPWYIKMMVGFGWFGVMAYWTTNPIAAIVAGEPTDVIVMLVFMGLGLAYLFMAVGSWRGSIDVETRRIVKTGDGMVEKIMKSTTNRSIETRQTGESALEYKQRIRKALGRKH